MGAENGCGGGSPIPPDKHVTKIRILGLENTAPAGILFESSQTEADFRGDRAADDDPGRFLITELGQSARKSMHQG